MNEQTSAAGGSREITSAEKIYVFSESGVNMSRSGSKASKGDIRSALQKILDAEYITAEGEKQTGADTIALTLYQQATDPQSPHYIKAVDTIMKLTSPKEQIETDTAAYKLIQATAARDTMDIFGDGDSFTQAARESIRERLPV